MKDHSATKLSRLEGNSWEHLDLPPAPAEQCHLQQNSHNHFSQALKSSKDQDLTNLSGQLVPAFDYLHVFRWNFLIFDLYPLTVRGHSWEKFSSLFSIPSTQVCIVIDKTLLSLLTSSLRSPGFLSLSSQERGSSSLIIFVILHKLYLLALFSSKVWI